MGVPFAFSPTNVPGVVLIQATAYEDSRGYFMESYKHSAFEANGIRDTFVQDNHSHSIRGVLRGLHYQLPPKAQAKLVSVLRGVVFDVAVDIRSGAPTYGHWVGTTLSGEDRRMLYVPVGFAHGFCVLSEYADVHYKVSEEYAPDFERGLRWDDPNLGINWPIDKPIVSDRDSHWPRLLEAGTSFTYQGQPG